MTTPQNVQTPQIEYVYAMESDAFPGLIKIGRTKDITKRLKSAQTFNSPKPFRLMFMTKTLDSKRDEHKTHEHFKALRECGEFFRVSPDELLKYFETEITPAFNKELSEWKEPTTVSRGSMFLERFLAAYGVERRNQLEELQLEIEEKNMELQLKTVELRMKETELRMKDAQLRKKNTELDYKELQILGLEEDLLKANSPTGNLDDHMRETMKRKYLELLERNM